MRLPAHEATTAQLGAVYPCVTTRRLPALGVLVGRDIFGGTFVHDPFELYRAGAITNPNILVLGQIGRGKSAFVKTYLLRQAAFGRRIVILDPKGEYRPFAQALGAEPITLCPGGPVRLNPLEINECSGRIGPPGAQARLSLVADLASACLGRPLGPAEHTAIELALDAVSHPTACPTLSALVGALLEPRPEAARSIGCGTVELAADGREVGLELRRLVSGELAGMFDGATTRGVDLTAPVVVVDLSHVYSSPALGALVTCAAAALGRVWDRPGAAPTFLVIDEGWAVVHNPGAVRFLQASFKLARARGVANIVVTHRVSDFAASGPAGSVTAQLAEGLVADCETVVCYAQADAEAPGAARLLGLSEAESRLLPRLRRGVSLWRVGARPYLVEHRLAPSEREIVDTDRRLVEPAPRRRW
ncbi:MAG: ATP-binding protein [Acidimicrobiales bacterium]|jgi:type IV secretory pathway VirB4 component